MNRVRVSTGPSVKAAMRWLGAAAAVLLAVVPPATGHESQAAKAGREPAADFDARAANAARARAEGQLDDAVGRYRALVEERPDWTEGQWYVGSLLYELRRPREARAAFARVLRQQPDHAGAMALGGLCAFDLGDHETALRDLLRSLQLHVQQTPEIARVVRYHAGMLFTRFSEFEAGNQLLTSVAAEADETPALIAALGANLLRLPLLPAEIPDGARPRIELAGRAGYAMARRETTSARSLLDDLRTRFGGTPDVEYLWGVFLAAQDPAAAIAAWQRELAISPTHLPARLQLASELVKQDRLDEAQKYAEDAVRVDPRHFAPRLALGQVLLARSDPAAAIATLEMARQLAPESAQSHYLLSVAYARAGRTADAERARDQFRRLSQTPGAAERDGTTPGPPG